MPDEMEETMLILSKGIKWLVVFTTGCYLAGAATVSYAPQRAGHEPIAFEDGNQLHPFPAIGINDLMQMMSQ
jgi:hypothetical protein